MQRVFIDHTSSQAFKLSSDLSDLVWKMVDRWNWFQKQTVGEQLVRSSDSICANIAEGFGRHHKKDKQKFYYNARGSACEVMFWIDKAHQRMLISPAEFDEIKTLISLLPKEINWLIKITEQKLKV